MNTHRGTHIQVRALLDSGCSRDLISPVLVMRLGLNLVKLKEVFQFEQMARTPVRGICVLTRLSQSRWEWESTGR